MSIDAVITWVNGQEPSHVAKRLEYGLANDSFFEHGAHPTRFNACGELDYCVRSLLYFAPWLRTIYLVTDAQQPDWLALLPCVWRNKIYCVDHREIFRDFEHFLPSFNSLAIETLLWRIPGLADQFIYFNDDVMLLRPVMPNDFFESGRMILRGRWRKFHALRRFRRSSTPDLHRQVQENSAQFCGFTKYYWDVAHVPHALFKAYFFDLFMQYPNLLTDNLQHRIRNNSQYSPIGLVNHWAIQSGLVQVDKKLQGEIIHTGAHDDQTIMNRIQRVDTDLHKVFVCMQSLDQASSMCREVLYLWLDQYIPSWDELYLS